MLEAIKAIVQEAETDIARDRKRFGFNAEHDNQRMGEAFEQIREMLGVPEADEIVPTLED